MGIGDLLDNAFWLLRKNFKLLFMISIVGGLPTLLLNLAATAFASEPLPLPNQFDDPFTSRFMQLAQSLNSPWSSLINILELMIEIFVTGALFVAASKRVWNLPASVKTSYLEGLGPAILILISGLLLSIVAGIAMIPGVIAFLIPIIGPVLGVIWIVGLAFAVGIRLSVYAPVIVTEHAGPVAALRRSWSLFSGNYWRAAGLFVSYALLSYALQFIPIILAGLSVAFVPDGKLAAMIARVILQLLTFALKPFSVILLTLLHIDLKVRNEALDIQMAAKAIAQENNRVQRVGG